MKKIQQTFFVFIFLGIVISTQAQFNPGNVVLLQLGDGISTLTNTGNPLIFKEFNSSGTQTYSVAITSTGTSAMVLRGNATSEGYISKSSDGNYIVFGAYMQSFPGSNVLNTSSASSINRGIGLVDLAGNATVGSISATYFSGGDIRGAVASNSANLWASSSNQGVTYFGTGAAGSNVENSKINLRALHIFNNQLYMSSQVATGTPTDIGVYAIGSGTPNTSAQTVTTVISCGSNALPGQFYFNNTGTICYIADARSNSSGGGVQKWVYASSTWSLAYTLPTSTTSGAFGVVVDFSGVNPLVYATSTEGTANKLVSILDNGSSATPTILSTAGANSIYRGLSFSPGSCNATAISSVTNSSPLCSAQVLSLNCNVAGTSPINYSWFGPGQYSSTSVANPTLVNAISGTYTLIATNACGTTSATTNVTANPTPTVLVNAATICSGGIATITASGANSYSWNTGNTNNSFTASPTSNTNYTLIGTTNGCSRTITTSINITTTPTLNISTATICVGKTATITATGATTYTWNNGANSGVITVSPSITSSYTLNANIAGCPNTLSATTQVNVLALPSVSLSASASVICANNKSVTITGSPSGGTVSGTALVGNNFNPSIAGLGNFVFNYVYTDANNCTNSTTTSINVSACLGLINQEKNSSFNLFPNPFNQEIFIQFQNEFSPTQIKIIDVLGKTIYSEILTNKENETHKINLHNIETGIYFVTLQTQNKTHTFKLIKE